MQCQSEVVVLSGTSPPILLRGLQLPVFLLTCFPSTHTLPPETQGPSGLALLPKARATVRVFVCLEPTNDIFRLS